ncbi:MAG: uracil-DNA glycosylase family protein [Saprospiraceae bacterium]
MTLFYHKYYNDVKKRTFILGINPGRFGAGITGIPFTDPIRLESLGIENSFQKRQELSSVFIYDMIRDHGGPEIFYTEYYIASLSPLGFVKDGRNYNYYDDRGLAEAVKPFIIQNIESQIKFGADLHKVFCLGQGKNFEFLKELNQEYKWWKEVIPLPHPRWVMQYKLKQKESFIELYKSAFRNQ